MPAFEQLATLAEENLSNKTCLGKRDLKGRFESLGDQSRITTYQCYDDHRGKDNPQKSIFVRQPAPNKQR